MHHREIVEQQKKTNDSQINKKEKINFVQNTENSPDNRFIQACIPNCL